MTISSSIGSVLHEARLGAGFTQRQLADRMKCKRTYISKVENDKVSPTLRSLEMFANGLGVTVWSLIREAESNSASAVAKRKEIGRALGTLPKETV